MDHFKEVCKCGRVIKQCKCIGDKEIKVTDDCQHATAQPVAYVKIEPQVCDSFDEAGRFIRDKCYSTVTNKNTDQSITWDKLYKEHQKVVKKYEHPKRLRCDPVWYKKLCDYVKREELEQIKNNPRYVFDKDDVSFKSSSTLFGTPIKIDEDMKENTWRFEDMFGDKYT